MKLSEMKNDDKKLWFRRLWIVLVAFLAYQVTSYAIRTFSVPRRVRKVVQAYPEQQKAIAAEAEKGDDGKKTAEAEDKMKGYLFTPPPGKPPMPRCTAILGDSALINDQWIKAGGEINGAKVVEIFPNYVMVTRDGQEHKLVPFEVNVQYNNGGQASRPEQPNGPSSPEQVSAPQQAEASEQPRRRRGGRAGGRNRPNGPMNMTAEQREMYERYQNASPEEQARMREEYMQRQGG